MKSYRRSTRVAELLKRELSQLIDQMLRKTDQPLLSVTEVTLTNDLRYAKVFVSSLAGSENKDEALSRLNKVSKKLRSALSQRVSLRAVPELSFRYDDSIEHGMKIEAILNSINRKDESTDTASNDSPSTS